VGVLGRVNQPADLLRLGDAELATLAAEVRHEILKTVSSNQGHLSSNLGVVELTIAMHYVFESPRDRILFDVGHQCYTHKLLTGRRDSFSTLRRYEGMSGFPRPSESPHDFFITGHAGTALSSAVGLAAARDIKGEDWKVVAVVGDGCLPNGMSMEAINHIGQLKPDLIVVLNDNEMAISKTVGALSAYLSRIMSGNFYRRVRAWGENYLKRFTKVGPPLAHLAKHAEEEIKGLLGPGILFEELGLRYMGPFDGNDMGLMIKTLKQAKELKGPTLIHVVTKKGKGFPPAEKDSIRYYAPPTFNIVTGEIAPRPKKLPSYSEIYTRTLIRLAEQDQRVVAVTAAMLEGTLLKLFQERFPNRIFDVGIAEEHAVTFAAGMAAAGLRPFVAIYSTFMQRAYDQVMHDVCLQNLPVAIGMDRSGLVGDDGPTHHGVFDFAFLRHLPGMVVMAPADENELAKMMALGLKLDGPSSVRFPRGAVAGVAVDTVLAPLPLGKGRMMRDGADVVLASVGTMLPVALAVAERLEREIGVSAAVVDARFVKPLDSDLIVPLASRCGRIVTLEEHSRLGGFGSAVLEMLAERGVSVPALIVGLPDEFIEHGPIQQLKERHGLVPAPIFERIRSFMGVRARK
jgi:1-deoxy-D-xylulose-5-phosphate synthase